MDNPARGTVTRMTKSCRLAGLNCKHVTQGAKKSYIKTQRFSNIQNLHEKKEKITSKKKFCSHKHTYKCLVKVCPLCLLAQMVYENEYKECSCAVFGQRLR